ncbi:hypothetical protein NDU88_002147 [Pleurodeles waltl]|uniref:Uncharacterized protein n=1 Tax=Pleurodeles waltl TaxID=8319 RepID=A0AAV7PA01_PLEWA|nr:hypothetical protein NDU88_002147 [Pleurodeles waltl]
MAGTGRLRSGTGTGRSQDAAAQDRQKLDAVLAVVECIGDSLERAHTSLEAKIDKVNSELVLMHADHHKLADKTGAIEARVDELTWNESHFLTTPEASWEWLESTGRTSGHTAERSVLAWQNRRSRVRGGDMRAKAVAHAPDLEQLIQERREAIHSAATISASPVASESETEISQPPSDRPTTPYRLSELGFAGGPPVSPAMADKHF